MKELEIYIKEKLKQLSFYDEEKKRYTFHSKRTGVVSFDVFLKIILESYYEDAKSIIYDLKTTYIYLDENTAVVNCALAISKIENNEFITKAMIFNAYIG